jgi:hypothetical protein
VRTTGEGPLVPNVLKGSRLDIVPSGQLMTRLIEWPYALEHPAVKRVTAIGRRTLGILHAKLNEVLHPNFGDCSALAESLSHQDAAIFCLAFFRPDRQISQPPRAGPVKAGRALRGHPKGLALIGPSTVASLIGPGPPAPLRCREIQTGGFRSNSHRW